VLLLIRKPELKAGRTSANKPPLFAALWIAVAGSWATELLVYFSPLRSKRDI
jgi:hypothetical protein